MSEFYVGQKVVCVNASCARQPWHRPKLRYDGKLDGLTEGAVYTVAKCYRDPDDGAPSIILAEIRREAERFTLHTPGYCIYRFRPLEEKPASIEVFRQIARAVSAGKVRKFEDA